MVETIKGKAAIVGAGQSKYYKYGKAPKSEFALALDAVLAACQNAGLDPKEIDGFASFSDDRNDPIRLSAALGLKELHYNNMVWGGGGGGATAAIANAASAVAAGYANYVVVFRGLAQGQYARFGQGAAVARVPGNYGFLFAAGLMTPAQWYSLKVRRFMHETGVQQEALRAIALNSYAHAQNNPGAVMYGRPLDAETYDKSRWIVEPFHLYDCCQENDGAAAVIVTTAERAKALRDKPAYVLAAAQGAGHRTDAGSFNGPDFGTAHFHTVSRRLYEMAGIGPKDVDVVQSYENFTGGVVMSLIEHGFCAPEQANEFFTPENLNAAGGRLPLNTSGGNLAEAYIHGMSLVVEGVRQIWGESPNQVSDAKVSMVCSGPMASPVSSVVFASEDVLR